MTKCRAGYGEEVTWYTVTKYSISENSTEVPQNIKNRVPYGPAIPMTIGISPKELKSVWETNICTFMFISALFTVTKIKRQPKYPQWKKGERTCGTCMLWNTI
jgi:hypothetical protein